SQRRTAMLAADVGLPPHGPTLHELTVTHETAVDQAVRVAALTESRPAQRSRGDDAADEAVGGRDLIEDEALRHAAVRHRVVFRVEHRLPAPEVPVTRVVNDGVFALDRAAEQEMAAAAAEFGAARERELALLV